MLFVLPLDQYIKFMYSDHMSVFELKCKSEVPPEVVSKGGKPLFSLCLKEAELFSEFLVKYAADAKDKGAEWYRDGLAEWEKSAVAGYIYQKIKGRIE